MENVKYLRLIQKRAYDIQATAEDLEFQTEKGQMANSWNLIQLWIEDLQSASIKLNEQIQKEIENEDGPIEFSDISGATVGMENER